MKNIAEIGLLVLSTIKKLTGKNVKYSLDDNYKSNQISHHIWNALLKKYVADNGLVNYKGFKKEKHSLEEYTVLLSKNPPSKNWTRNEQLAYWINAYNAFTVLLIIEHYPVKSIKEIGGNIPMINSVWDIKFFKIGELDFDLDTIEHDILRKQFDEPRIHFAINCAAISCPRLRNEAYSAIELEEQLEEQTIFFINNSTYNLISSNKVKLSKIFDWFKSDFTKNQTIFEFLEKYVSFKFNNGVILEYFEYNWKLNEIKN